VALIKGMGLTHYRCSIAWSRIMPTGRGAVNEPGVAFYGRLFDELLAAGVEPVVTLYHWDLPQALEDEGGWLSEATVGAFAEYARVVFDRFGGRVRTWTTFNEPHTFVRQGYSEGRMAPGRCSDASRCDHGDSFTEPYLAAHNVLRAHAAAVAVFRQRHGASTHHGSGGGGAIGIVLNGEWAEPASRSAADAAASQRYLEAQLGWFADPIYLGDYPASLKERVGPRLPEFTAAEKSALQGSSDYFALNFYNAVYVAARASDLPAQAGTDFWAVDLGLAFGGLNPYTGQAIGLRGESVRSPLALSLFLFLSLSPPPCSFLMFISSRALFFGFP
jgi:beta-glucosidase